MGAQVSTQVATQTTTVVNRAMTNMVNKSTTSASAVNVNTNQIDLDLTGANIEGCDLDFIPHHPRQMKIDVALSNSFGFGGTNATLIFRRV